MLIQCLFFWQYIVKNEKTLNRSNTLFACISQMNKHPIYDSMYLSLTLGFKHSPQVSVRRTHLAVCPVAEQLVDGADFSTCSPNFFLYSFFDSNPGRCCSLVTVPYRSYIKKGSKYLQLNIGSQKKCCSWPSNKL